MPPAAPRRPSAAPSFGPLSTVRYEVNGVSFDMVRVPPGRFMDGVGEIKRELLVSRPFEIGLAPVSQELWSVFHSGVKGGPLPVGGLNVPSVEFFIAALAVQGLPGFRLPTEEEWAWAVRCGSPTLFAGSDRSKAVASAASRKSLPLASRPCSAVGAFDFSGSVWQWVDGFHVNQPQPGVDPLPLHAGNFHTTRGGSWKFSAPFSRVSSRINHLRNSQSVGVGFRLCRPLG
jgi:formylglycine-generating enzyme required for sulfatase activity